MSTKCPKNVEKMSENVQKLSRGAKTMIFGHFWGQFLPIWSMLLFGDPVQCAPVTSTVDGVGRTFQISDICFFFSVCLCSSFVVSFACPCCFLPLEQAPNCKLPSKMGSFTLTRFTPTCWELAEELQTLLHLRLRSLSSPFFVEMPLFQLATLCKVTQL